MKNKPMKTNENKQKESKQTESKAIDKHSNYKSYVLFPAAKKMDDERLRKVIEMTRDRCGGKGYIRFMAVSNNQSEEPMCILYKENKASAEKLTKMITLGELEEYLKAE